MEFDILDTYKKIKEVSKKFPDVKFLFSEARDAMRKSLKLKKFKNIKVKQILKKNVLSIKINKKIFGVQPFLAIKTKDNKYYNDNFDIQKPFYEWSYTFDENTIKLDQIKEIGWAANNSYGSTYVSNFSLKNKKFKLYEY